jgi:hypothetical protein
MFSANVVKLYGQEGTVASIYVSDVLRVVFVLLSILEAECLRGIEIEIRSDRVSWGHSADREIQKRHIREHKNRILTFTNTVSFIHQWIKNGS